MEGGVECDISDRRRDCPSGGIAIPRGLLQTRFLAQNISENFRFFPAPFFTDPPNSRPALGLSANRVQTSESRAVEEIEEVQAIRAQGERLGEPSRHALQALRGDARPGGALSGGSPVAKG